MPKSSFWTLPEVGCNKQLAVEYLHALLGVLSGLASLHMRGLAMQDVSLENMSPGCRICMDL